LSPLARAWLVRTAALAAGLAAAFAHPPFGFLPGLLGYAALLWLCDEPAHLFSSPSGGSDSALRAERMGVRGSAAAVIKPAPGAADRLSRLWRQLPLRGSRDIRAAFFRGWLAGLGYFAVSTWWVGEAFFVDAAEQAWMAPFAVIFLAAGLALFWGAGAALYRALAPAGAARLIVFAGAMTAAEWMRGHLFTGFPWDLPGETWRAGSAPSQAASLVGAYGLTWITVAIAAAPGLGWRGRDARIALAGAAAGLVALYGFGAWRLVHAITAPAPGAPLVRIVQPGIPEIAATPANFAAVLGRNLALTRASAAKPPDIVIWSEQGLPAALEDYLAPGTWTRAAIAAALAPGQVLITGGFRAEPAPAGAYAPDGVLYYNSLWALRRQGDDLAVIAAYDKHRLTPFGEYLPFARFVAPLGVQQLVHVGQGFSPGPPPRPIRLAGAPPAQPLICYESLFPGFTRQGARLAGFRPAWIVNISDDAWFGATMGPWQHLNIASYRAIEEGLPMLRATPTGVSAAVDAYGRLLPGRLLGEGDRGVIDVTLPPALAPTGFDRCGAVPLGVMLLVSLAFAYLGRRATMRRNGAAR
jgi:apolipoprotein N-acyltransferase